MKQNTYQQEDSNNPEQISISDIIQQEEDLIKYILQNVTPGCTLDLFRQKYIYFSRDVLIELDKRFKNFLVDFFNSESLPAFALFIKNDGNNHMSEFILHNLEKSLQPAVFNKLLKTAVQKAPPYIPLIKFFREEINNSLPLFPVYQWQQEPVIKAFQGFINNRFPEYQLHNPTDYINKLLKENPYAKCE